MDEIVKTSQIEQDDIVRELALVNDLPFTGESETRIKAMPAPPKEFGVGLIVGPSGSGKSTILAEVYGGETGVEWDPGRAICSHFDGPKQAAEQLGAAGLKTIPAWLRPYHALSTGEKFRADLARQLESGGVVDEFTSVVDRNVAKSACVSMRKYIDRKKLTGIVLATCHYDIIPWLEPDWVYDVAAMEMVTGRGLHQRPPIRIKIYTCKRNLWELFKHHHYLTQAIHPAADCFAIVWDTGDTEELVGFFSTLPHFGAERLRRRGHRLVIFPDYQGFGVGTKAHEAILDLYLQKGYRFNIRLAHPGLLAYFASRPELYKFVGGKNKRGAEGFGRVGSDRPTKGYEYLGAKEHQQRYAEARRIALEKLEEGGSPERVVHREERPRKDGKPIMADHLRCTWEITGVGRCRAARANDEDLCNFHGSRHAEISQSGAEAVKTLWADIKAKADQLPANDWGGMAMMARSILRDQLTAAEPDVRGMSAIMQRLEKALEESPRLLVKKAKTLPELINLLSAMIPRAATQKQAQTWAKMLLEALREDGEQVSDVTVTFVGDLGPRPEPEADDPEP